MVLTLAVATIGAYAAVNSGLIPANADAKPSHLERWAAKTSLHKTLNREAPQLADRGVEDDPPGVTYWKVTHGIRLTGMPAFAKTLTNDRRWKLTLFLDHMDKLPPKADKARHTMI